MGRTANKLMMFLALCATKCVHIEGIYKIDSADGLGRKFDGIGAISGGGATSKLLMSYPEKQAAEVLDYLFKPKFGASLHILKVEIGGDAQSSEGTEASHMHEPWDENYNRGYEWLMMKEAKKRNPGIELVGLPWGYPGWLGQGHWWPFMSPNATADYITRWVQGALSHHGLQIDYLGIWNEKWYDPEYVKVLRKTLDVRGFNKVKIIAADLLPIDCWDVVDDVNRDPELNKAVDILGCHYGHTASTSAAKETEKPLWSSEDWSTNNDELGGGCMARILNRNYVNGLITSTIAWNTLYAYYSQLPYPGTGLMTANEPWSGHYTVKPPIWATAHTTQFTEPGWHYLKHRSGVGWLDAGGSYVTLLSPDNKQVTIIIETMDAQKHDMCVRDTSEQIPVKPQNATFKLGATLSSVTTLNLWHTKFGLDQQESIFLENLGSVEVKNQTFSIYLDVNSIYTFTTINDAAKGSHGNPPPPGQFPLPYKDTFESYPEHQEASYFTQQVGVFEIHNTSQGHGKVMRQVMLNAPVHWCPVAMKQPMAVMGNYSWGDIHAEISIFVSSVNGTDAAYLALNVDQGGCYSLLARGIFFFLDFDAKMFQLTSDLVRAVTIARGVVTIQYDTWYTVSLEVQSKIVTAVLDGQTLYRGTIDGTPTNGFVAVGTNTFGIADFDNFVLFKP